ncbi:MAG: hypothetical protein Q8Q52_06865 [Acidimicrobiia bacterium]|nr:hypothetical protein [Acidimicrobiia bacterium]
MPAAAIVTLIATGLLVAALAFYLIRIALTLRTVVDTLGIITFGVRAIAHQVEPVNPIVTEIRQDLEAVDLALKALLIRKAR